VHEHLTQTARPVCARIRMGSVIVDLSNSRVGPALALDSSGQRRSMQNSRGTCWAPTSWCPRVRWFVPAACPKVQSTASSDGHSRTTGRAVDLDQSRYGAHPRRSDKDQVGSPALPSTVALPASCRRSATRRRAMPGERSTQTLACEASWPITRMILGRLCRRYAHTQRQ